MTILEDLDLMADETTEYDRGKTAGEIAARLADHDKHFAKINGSMREVANELHDLKLTQQGGLAELTAKVESKLAELVLAVQQLRDQAKADQKTVVTTAAALKSAEDARRDKTEQTWSPVTKLIAVLGAVAGTVLMAVSLYQALK